MTRWPGPESLANLLDRIHVAGVPYSMETMLDLQLRDVPDYMETLLDDQLRRDVTGHLARVTCAAFLDRDGRDELLRYVCAGSCRNVLAVVGRTGWGLLLLQPRQDQGSRRFVKGLTFSTPQHGSDSVGYPWARAELLDDARGCPPGPATFELRCREHAGVATLARADALVDFQEARRQRRRGRRHRMVRELELSRG